MSLLESVYNWGENSDTQAPAQETETQQSLQLALDSWPTTPPFHYTATDKQHKTLINGH